MQASILLKVDGRTAGPHLIGRLLLKARKFPNDNAEESETRAQINARSRRPPPPISRTNAFLQANSKQQSKPRHPRGHCCSNSASTSTVIIYRLCLTYSQRIGRVSTRARHVLVMDHQPDRLSQQRPADGERSRMQHGCWDALRRELWQASCRRE